jgi:hypothetical protein
MKTIASIIENLVNVNIKGVVRMGLIVIASLIEVYISIKINILTGGTLPA